MKVVLFGKRNFMGNGVFYSAFCDQLKSLSRLGRKVVEVNLYSRNDIAAAQQASAPDDLNIWFKPHPAAPAFLGKTITFAIFESTRLPGAFIDKLAPADLVWTPSDWGRAILTANGVDESRIDVVPEGVDAAAFHPYLRPRLREASKPFRFLTIAKLEQRKSYEELLTAFSAAFAGRDDTHLVVKGDFFAEPGGRIADLKALIDRFPEIKGQVRMVSGYYDTAQIIALYDAADAFVFPSKAEGWGLPLIEAMASGVPVITTDYSGHAHFLAGVRDQVSIVEHELVDIEDEGFRKAWPTDDGRPGRWAQPSVDSLAAKMRAVRDRHEEHQAKAFVASDVIRRDFPWSNSAYRAMASLRDREFLKSASQADLLA